MYPRSELCKFIGYDGKSPAYIVYFSESDEIKRIRCVKFLDEPNYDVEIIYEDGDIPFLKPQPSEVQIETEKVTSENILNKEKQSNSNETISHNPTPHRERKKPAYLNDYVIDSDESDTANCSIDYCYRLADTPSTIQSPDLLSGRKLCRKNFKH